MSGKERCRMHGGKSTGRPPIHGRYAKEPIQRKREWRRVLRELRKTIKEAKLTGPLRIAARVLEKKADHFLRGIGPFGIGVRATGTSTRPGVAGPVDPPLL
jgi:hypothetical protein